MEIFDFFGNTQCNFMAYSSIAMFAIFLVYARIFNLAAGESCHARLNKANAVFFAIYLIIALAYCIVNSVFSIDIAAAILGGSFVFVSLHQIYLMAFVGLAKKSVSASIVEMAGKKDMSEKDLEKMFSSNTDEIRLNRLEQMKFLGLATETEGKFTITKRGSFFNRQGNSILGIWGLERL